eukprot:scaffold325046_cov30-Prasinocladus_malaysianus.AAC.1
MDTAFCPNEAGASFGAAVTISEVIDALEASDDGHCPGATNTSLWSTLAHHLKRVANVQNPQKFDRIHSWHGELRTDRAEDATEVDPHVSPQARQLSQGDRAPVFILVLYTNNMSSGREALLRTSASLNYYQTISQKLNCVHVENCYTPGR